MGRSHLVLLSVLVGVGFAVTYAIRGDVLPGLVGGVLAAILLFVAVGRFQEQHAAQQARRERERG
jgi:uncharacterized protein (DUF2062 family)